MDIIFIYNKAFDVTGFTILLIKIDASKAGGGKPLDHEVPIHVVTESSQLPAEFLNPSAEKQLIIGFDCEGVDLCRHGTLCIMQLAFPDAIYLVDAVKGGESLIQACKPALESSHITKVIHDCKRDSEALFFQFGIKLHNVVDTQIAYSQIEEQEGRIRLPDDYISFVGLLADPRYCAPRHNSYYEEASDFCKKIEFLYNPLYSCDLYLEDLNAGISYLEKEEVRVLLRQDPMFWTYRPLSEMMIRAAADDVRFLLHIYYKMMEKLNQRSLWYLAVRGMFYCRCFCINENDYADWPHIPPIPDNLIIEDTAPEEEILSALDVPPGKMGRVIGRRGASILSVKESCNAEIFIGGAKGPPDKVFIVGPVKQVRKAEAMLRGKMLDIY
ncbi:hypothetical protein OIU85_013154 [Salix viminalis]|uniref:3'-5' exonuclease domain-containing protein n=1 Tax=Salix viminalis TaxID=40686 RepID=A0A9Q0NQR0_SALVM|nr:hypothetical protein OIU85_013154 [Salix viminalis]